VTSKMNALIVEHAGHNVIKINTHSSMQ